jgi:rod shape-determining protein MreC
VDSTKSVQSMKLWILDRIMSVTGGPGQTLRFFQSDQGNRILKTRLAQRELDFALCREIRYENERLRTLLDLRTRSDYILLPAEITSRGTRVLPGSVHLNVGSDKGCRRNLALIAQGGAAGRLVAAGRSSSVGQLLNDPASRISGMVQRSRVLGIVQWLYGDVFTLKGVPVNSNVTVGDTVVTSGYSDIYPKGLPIGQITHIEPDESGLFLNIQLRPAIDFSKLETVFVVIDSLKHGED